MSGHITAWRCVTRGATVPPYSSRPSRMDISAASQRIAGPGFIAALDQSGGSTPDALAAYGIAADAWGDDKEKMFSLMHEMRARIIVNPAFDRRVSGAILFERTMLGTIDGLPTARYLWEKKDIVPFLKVDEGLAERTGGVQLMKPMAKLESLLKSAVEHGIFGTKMRSVIHAADAEGIAAVVKQQFEVGDSITAAGLMPIIEPEVSIKSADKAACEALLRDAILKHLDLLPADRQVMLKLTLPDQPDFYASLVVHPRVLRVVALSGGYPREEANAKLAQNHGVIASFSRALVEDLRVGQTEAEFTAALDAAIDGIYQASLS